MKETNEDMSNDLISLIKLKLADLHKIGCMDSSTCRTCGEEDNTL